MASLRCFQLVPILDKVVDTKDVSKHAVTALECWRDDLFVGTKSGIIVHYALIHGTSPTGKVTCQTAQKGKVSLAANRRECSIQQLMVAPAERKLLVVSHGIVTILSMDDVTQTNKAKEKDFKLLCRDEGLDLANRTVTLSAVKRKDRGISPYEFFNGTLAPLKGSRIRDLDDDRYRGVVSMARDGNKLCVVQETPAKTKMVGMVNLADGTINTVWDADVSTAPIVKRLSQNEFLFTQSFEEDASTCHTLGTVITGEGVPSGKNPIQMNFVPLAAACTYPYVLMLGNTGAIVVHSLLDQKEKQIIQFPEGKLLCDTGGKIIIAGDNRISLLDQISFESQIDELLTEHRVTEALTLAEVTFSSSKIDLDAEEFQRQREGMLALQRRAGLTYLKMNRFADGFDLLAASNTDPREMIALFPDLLPKSSTYSSLASTTGISDISQIVEDPTGLRAAHKALANFLTIMRSDHVPKAWASDIDTVLAVLFGILSPDKLIKFISKKHVVVLQDAIEHLRKHERHHAVALLHAQNGAPHHALDIWRRIDSGELSDPGYPGVSYAVEFLAGLKVAADAEPDERGKLIDAIFIHAEWQLKRDPTAVRVFLRDPAEHNEMFRPDTVLEFLRPFGFAAILDYLEYLIGVVNSTSERYHTRLAMYYVEPVQRGLIEGEAARRTPEAKAKFASTRVKLRRLLLTSKFLDVNTLLERVTGTDLHQEMAILHGKQGDYHKAIALLVHKLRDYVAAEEFVVETTAGQDRATTTKVFLTLLEVYLDPASGGLYHEQALDLMANHAAKMDVHKVLPLLPDSFGLSTLEEFLRRSIRRSLNTQRVTRITHGLARQEYLQVAAQRHNLRVRSVVITERTRCSSCGKRDANLETEAIAIDMQGRVFCRTCAGLATNLDPRRNF